MKTHLHYGSRIRKMGLKEIPVKREKMGSETARLYHKTTKNTSEIPVTEKEDGVYRSELR